MDHEQHQTRQHDAGENRAQQQQIGLVGKRFDIVARLQANSGILLVQPFQPALNVGDPLLQLRRVGLRLEQFGDLRPDSLSLLACLRRARALDGDVHVIKHGLQKLIGFGGLSRARAAKALVDIMLERNLRQADVVRRDEGGVVDRHRIVDYRVLLVAREQADRQIDGEEKDRHHAELAAKRSRIFIGGRTMPPATLGWHVFRSRINFHRGHFFPLQSPSWRTRRMLGGFALKRGGRCRATAESDPAARRHLSLPQVFLTDR